MVKQDPDRQEGSSDNRPQILAAVDFSEDSEAALHWACGYAAQIGAEVVALHVIHDPIDMPGSYRRSEADVLRPTADLAAEMLDKFVKSFAERHPDLAALSTLKTRLVEGIPETRVLEFAERIDAVMIVIGSRGLTGLPHLLLGSKAERIAQLSPRPVTIVKREAAA